jgi:hypothetical protein
LAQAIWKVKQSRRDEEIKKFINKLRIYTITDQDMDYNNRMNRTYSSHMWLRKDFSVDLQFIWDEGTWQEQCELGKRAWQLHKNNIQGHGSLGSEYPTYKWGVEGDTPSFLYLMPNGLNDPEDPTQTGWAGYHERGICPDSLTTAWNSWQEPVRSISIAYKQRFYPDELNDFIARIEWAEKGSGNKNPIVIVNNQPGLASIHINARVNDVIKLDASNSYDPDNENLSFTWWQQPEIGDQLLSIDGSQQPKASVAIPSSASGKDFHIICEVHDDGPYQLVAYRRVIITIE